MNRRGDERAQHPQGDSFWCSTPESRLEHIPASYHQPLHYSYSLRVHKDRQSKLRPPLAWAIHDDDGFLLPFVLYFPVTFANNNDKWGRVGGWVHCCGLITVLVKVASRQLNPESRSNMTVCERQEWPHVSNAATVSCERSSAFVIHSISLCSQRDGGCPNASVVAI